MTCWEILGISPNSDKSSIKKAYAALLKKNKPDENPHFFTELHAAYKESLHHAKIATENPNKDTQQEPYDNNTTQEIDEVQEALITNQTASNEPKKPSITPPEVEHQENKNQGDYIQQLNKSWEKIIILTDNAIEQLNNSDDISAWIFLNDYPELYDFQFKNRYSYYLFERLMVFFNEENKKKSYKGNEWDTPPKAPLTILHFISKQLDWLNMLDSFEYEYGEKPTAYLFNALLTPAEQYERPLLWTVPRTHQGELQSPSYLARFSASFIDILIFYCVFSHLSSVLYTNDTIRGVLVVPTIYFLIIPLMECSPMQGSIGKILLGLKVTNRKGERLNIFHAYFRQVMYFLHCSLFKFIFWTNLFFIKKKYFLHDKMSASRVINRY